MIPRGNPGEGGVDGSYVTCLRRCGALDGAGRSAASSVRPSAMIGGSISPTACPRTPRCMRSRFIRTTLMWSISAPPKALSAAPTAATRWEKLSLPGKDADIWSVCIHPKNPRIVYAGATPPGVYRSEDGGDTWRKTADPGLARPGDHGVPVPGHAARCRSQFARRHLCDARSQWHDAQPQRRRDLGGLHRRSDPLLRGAQIPQPHRQPDRDRGDARRPCARRQRRRTRHRVPRQPHGPLPQRATAARPGRTWRSAGSRR